MPVRVGTSGFSYKEWKGSFYPEKLKAADMLRFYAGRFGTVEINNTFYRMPTAALLLRWAEETPESFRFVLKAPQRITHRKRLAGAGEDVAYFLETARQLGPKLGPMLFQLPPNLQKDLDRLRGFLADLPAGQPVAFEFRHPSWFDAPVYDALREHDAALCAAETDEPGGLPESPLSTASWGYLRLRRAEYSDAELLAWARRVADQGWKETYVFFKHEDEGRGPDFAARFAAVVAAPTGPPEPAG
jgi:uncharacterized protein YecE (DUF72 family)